MRLRSVGWRPMGFDTVVGKVVFRRDEQTGGVFVDAVDDPRALLPADAGETVSAVEKQGVHQGPVRVAGGGVHHQASGLVHHDHVAVLIDHVQRNVLGEERDLLRFRQGEQKAVPGGAAVVLADRRSPQEHPPLL